MSIFCFGVSHQTAAVDVRERFAIPASALAEALGRLKTMPGLAEGLILSTCNRTEFYVTGEFPDSQGFSRASIEISGPAMKRICSAYAVTTVFVTYFESLPVWNRWSLAKRKFLAR
jgi:glutamyl-tRNA reductase